MAYRRGTSQKDKDKQFCRAKDKGIASYRHSAQSLAGRPPHYAVEAKGDSGEHDEDDAEISPTKVKRIDDGKDTHGTENKG